MELLRVYADAYIELGKLFGEQGFTLYAASLTPDKPLTVEERDGLIKFLKNVWFQCTRLNLVVSEPILSKAINDPPQGHRELNILMSVVLEEIKSHLFIYIPTQRAMYFDVQFPETMINSFPEASNELARASKCYCKGEDTACVFHSMRAAEIALRALAKHLQVSFPFGITLADWKNIIDQIEKEIKTKEQLRKGTSKDEELKFLSDAASQFRYFKNAYRIFVSHARESYGDEQALSIMTRTREFIESLSYKLREEIVSP